MADLFAGAEDHTQFRRRESVKLVERWRDFDAPAKRLSDEECGADTVSKEVYTSREYFELEKKFLWPRIWQIACREHDVPEVGDYFEYSIVEDTILVVRTAPGTIKGYFNVCQHRGRKLRDGCGNSERLRCGYHGWCWDLDGNILEVLDSQDFCPEIMDPEDLALKPVRVETWGGFVFINMDQEAPPLHEAIAPMPARVDRYLYERLRYNAWKTTVLPCNWKLGVDAFQESYHAFVSHPQTNLYIDDTRLGAYERWDNGMANLSTPGFLDAVARPSARLGIDPDPKEILMTMVEDLATAGLLSESEYELVSAMKDLELPPGEEGRQMIRSMFTVHRRAKLAAVGVDVSTWPDEEVSATESFLMFPNTLGPIQLGTGFLCRVRPNGNDHESCILDYWDLQFYPPGEEPRRVIEELDDISSEHWPLLVAQDLKNLEALGTGVRSRGFTGPRLGYQENNIKFYYRRLAEILGWKTGEPPRPVY
jgi:phenylpropionate dioxygenase-like ring-hydroxylating dioxygenase large terminal subunit